MIEAEIRTRFTPPIRVGLDDLAGGGRGGPPLLVRLLRPAVTVRTPLGTVREAPAGDPGDAWQLWIAGLVAGVVLLVALAVAGVVSLARR